MICFSPHFLRTIDIHKSDRPERLMNIRLSSQALNWEIGDFGRVLEVLGNFSELDELKGLWLREYLKNAPDNSFLNLFTNEELGRIFDFDYRGINYLGLRFSPWALERILEIEPGDNIYGWDLFLNPIKLQILQENMAIYWDGLFRLWMI